MQIQDFLGELYLIRQETYYDEDLGGKEVVLLLLAYQLFKLARAMEQK
jgi:hypothetical protein